jgi:23S rRNA maturation mini-RNase III
MFGMAKLYARCRQQEIKKCRNLQDFREMQALETLLGLLTMRKRVEEGG